MVKRAELQAASHRADASDASPVRLLVHAGRLVELAEEEVHLLLHLVGGRNYGGAGKLGIWGREGSALIRSTTRFFISRRTR